MAVNLPDAMLYKLWRMVEVSRERWAVFPKNRFDRNLDLYKGAHWKYYPEDEIGPAPLYEPSGLKEVTVNYTAAGIEIKWAGDTAQDPKFEASPKITNAPMDPMTRALLSEVVTQDFVGASGGWKAAQAIRLDYAVFGIGIGMTCLRRGEEEPIPPQPGEHDAIDAANQAAMDMLAGMMGSGAVFGPAVQPLKIGDLFEVVGEGPMSFRISPYDFIIDPHIAWDNWQDARFVGRTYVEPVEVVQADPRFKNTDGLVGVRLMAQTQNYILDPVAQTASQQEKEAYAILADVWFRQVEIQRPFRFHGVRYPPGLYPVRIVWAVERPNVPLLVELWPYDIRDDRRRRQYPFHLIVNRPVPGQLVGQGDPEIGEHQQRELNLARSQELTHGDQIRAKFMVRKGSIDDEARMALENNTIGVVVELNQEPASQPILPLPRPELPADIHQSADHAQEDLSALTGVDDAARGTPMPGDQTATEARLIAAKSASRAAKDAQKFEELLTEMAAFQWSVRCEYGITGDEVRVRTPRVGMDGGGMNVMILGEEHLVPVNISLLTGSTRIQDKQLKLERIERFAALAEQLQQVFGPMNPGGVVNPLQLLELHAEAGDFTDNLEPLFDTSDLRQMLIEQQQQQMALQAQAQQQALAQAGGMGGLPAPGAPQGLPAGAPPPQLTAGQDQNPQGGAWPPAPAGGVPS